MGNVNRTKALDLGLTDPPLATVKLWNSGDGYDPVIEISAACTRYVYLPNTLTQEEKEAVTRRIHSVLGAILKGERQRGEFFVQNAIKKALGL